MANHTEAVAEFRRGLAALESAIVGATPEETAFAPAPGKWNIKQLARHVADTEIVVGMRLRQIIAEDNPTLIPFDQEKWAANLGYQHADALDSLARFRSLREDTTRLLESLPPATFERTGNHPERGVESLLAWVERFGKHVHTHAAQIRAVRDAWNRR
ncbi:MAG TPA: DinB family protein [Bryobacteraceae bacterium]|nr:DinB family protein [Bryobacteraceae bacterium]